MPRKARPTRTRVTPIVTDPRPTLRVLVVDGDGDAATFPPTLDGKPATVTYSRSLAEARHKLAQGPVDLLLVDPHLPDGSGLELAGELGRSGTPTRTIIITRQPSLDETLQAMRCGVQDLLTKPLNLDELNERVREVLARQQRDVQREQRIRRLRRVCKKLNRAREDITRQVDTLCNDLVTAYQELAMQMQQVVQTSEFAGVIRDELDLEQLLRKTLEYLIHKAGPTNAAIFLPSTLDEYSLGGYVNYDCTADSADVLLEHLADVVAPRIAERSDLIHITDNDTLAQWIGDDAAYFEDSHVLGFACRHKQDTLAVIVLFRDGSAAFDETTIEACAAIGPLLGDYLAKIIRIHHRHLPDGPEFDADDEDDALPF